MGQNSMKKVYKESKRINIDDNSKIVILSDVHRGDGSFSDALIGNKNIYIGALVYYYKRGYTLIEAGDGDELWKNKSFIDIAYNYNGIFKILNKFRANKRLYMLYGNHDYIKSNKELIKKEISKINCIDEYIGREFVNFARKVEFMEGLVLNYSKIDKDIFITHGNQLDPMNYELCKISKFLVRYIWRILAGVAGFKEPTSPANNYKKGGLVDKKLEQWAKKHKKMLICGHTHKSRFPDVNDVPYFNDGCCVQPSSISCLEIEDGKISLVKWSVYVREDAVLYIDRSVIGGPEPLECYLKNTTKEI